MRGNHLPEFLELHQINLIDRESLQWKCFFHKTHRTHGRNVRKDTILIDDKNDIKTISEHVNLNSLLQPKTVDVIVDDDTTVHDFVV